jgi:hypothetical protein
MFSPIKHIDFQSSPPASGRASEPVTLGRSPVRRNIDYALNDCSWRKAALGNVDKVGLTEKGRC